MPDPRLQPNPTDAAAGAAIAALLSLIRGKLKFMVFIGVVFVAGMIAIEGFTTKTIVIGVIAIFVIGLFAALVWFWTAAFTSLNSEKKP